VRCLVRRIHDHRASAEKGFTIVELLIAMSLFIVVLVIASNAFNLIVTKATQYSKMEESNIEGVIGLETMRHDLAQMGFGLPWGFSQGNASPPTDLIDSTISYQEASAALTLAAAANDATGGVPRAFVGYAGAGSLSSDFIALKATNLGRSKASQRWTYIPFHNFSAAIKESRPYTYASNNPQAGDKVVFINSNANDSTNKDHRLIVAPNTPASFSTSFSALSNGISSNFLPTDDENTYMVFGVDENTLRMPFNRADYFINNATGVVPPFCAPLTGVLYKATVSHNGGGYDYQPILDCVADMQVVLGWDTSDAGKAGTLDTYSSLPQLTGGTVTASPSTAAASIQGWLTNAQGLREHLKVVKIYILAQEGKRDRNYTAPITNITVGDVVADGFRTKADYALSSDQLQYRWKLYRIVVRPKNLLSNQR